jgi:hypothetical protein
MRHGGARTERRSIAIVLGNGNGNGNGYGQRQRTSTSKRRPRRGAPVSMWRYENPISHAAGARSGTVIPATNSLTSHLMPCTVSG